MAATRLRYKQCNVMDESRNTALWWLKSLSLKKNTVDSERQEVNKGQLETQQQITRSPDASTTRGHTPTGGHTPSSKPNPLLFLLILLQFHWISTGTLRCSAGLLGCHVYMAPCRSSSRCSLCRRRSCRRSRPSASRQRDQDGSADRGSLSLSPCPS